MTDSLRVSGWLAVSVLVLAGAVARGAVTYSTADPCFVCRKPLMAQVYTWMDKVTNKRELVCEACVKLPNNCYVCSLPVTDTAIDLRDTRFLCERDAKSVMLDAGEILALCRETHSALDTQLSRFLSLPENVEFSVVDRQTIIELTQIPGHDFGCPNVLGYTRVETNEAGEVSFPIAILSGMTRAATISTCAHELGHTWSRANIPAARFRRLNRDAAEGFCELLAYMRLRELGETVEISNLRSNLYTRGQMDLFIAAEERFGFNSVMDWMRNGRHDRLLASEPWRVQDLMKEPAVAVTAKVETARFVPVAPAPPPPLPDRLQLKSVTLGKKPMALINQCTLAVGETGKVQLAHTNLTVRCVAITANQVTVEIVGSGERRELKFNQ